MAAQLLFKARGRCEKLGLNEGQTVLTVAQKGFEILMRGHVDIEVMSGNYNYGKRATCV